jgi:hypothetical protein
MGISDLNSITLRHLKYKKKQTDDEIKKYKSRIQYLKMKDEINISKELMSEKR